MALVDDRKTASLTACVAYVLGVNPSEVPGDGGVRLNQWLAGRNLGLVPVESPQSFKWPGRFLGLRGGPSGSSTWAVFFGVPPGVVYDPQIGPGGQPSGEPPGGGADAALAAAFVLAQHDPWRGIGPGREAEGTGSVGLIALSAEAEGPMTVAPSAEAIEGRGLRSDRYGRGSGPSRTRTDAVTTSPWWRPKRWRRWPQAAWSSRRPRPSATWWYGAWHSTA